MICQACGVEAPTQKVFFVRHIGAIVMFFHKSIGGELCRKCVNKYFMEYGGTTLVAGWWGMISMFATPVVLVIDVFNYFRAWNLAPVPPDATAPRLTDEVVRKLQPLTPNLVARLNKGEDLNNVAKDVALGASVTPGQVVTYVRALIAQQRNQGPTSAAANAPMTGRP